MSFNKYFSLKSLIEAGKAVQDDLQVVTFDLFDTLVIRRVHDPDLVKLPVARFIATKAEADGIVVSPERVQLLRDEIESQHRAETGKQFDDHEACYPHFMKELLQHIFNRDDVDSLLHEVTEYEMFMESQMIVPRAELVAWLIELSDMGKRVFVVSDIYLPAENLRTLVERAGFLDCVEDVISSADTFLAKASGNAFPYLEKKYDLQKKGWLHVGDNPISDGLRPSEYGINAIILNDASEKQRKSITKRYLNYSKGLPFWRGRALQQLMQPHEGENIAKPALYREGYTFLAPIIGGFVQQIAEKCIAAGVKKIFFLSREGYTFKRFWEKAMPALYPQGGLPEIEYLYVSRMALAGASCAYQGLTRVNAHIAFLPPGNRDFRDICRIYKFDCGKFIPILERFGLRIDTCLSPMHDGYSPDHQVAFEQLLDDEAFQAEVKLQVRPSSEAMQRYFEDAGVFDHKQIAVVDIGWLGTIQRFLHEAIQHRTDCPRIFGYLLGATRGIEFPATPDNNLEGIIYDKHKFDMAGSTLLLAQDVFEEACRAPHATLNGYTLTDDGYELDFRQTDDSVGRAELEQDEYFAPLQQGLLDGAERYGAASSLLGYSLHDYKPWFNYLLVSKLAFPKAREVAAIRHKHHLDDFHGQHKLPKKSGAGKLTSLWQYPLFAIRFSPLLRTRLFIGHLRARIRE
ncbi:HAD family hydrolase [Desulfosediminicola flagellatus]|uniref:HAD family hydrolase n=1 Tax=Desulfosediminicola flagellatus TaxID=2569541 RepID=UPI0010AC07A7|nr:HAD family hydrolase [Desulfosediminicola flagellatus]